MPIVLQSGDDGTVLTGSNPAVTLKFPSDTSIGGSGLSVLGTITSTSATAFAVGRQGATNPVVNINASAATVVTGLTLVGAAAASGMAVTVTSSGTDENLTVDAKGAGTMTLNGTATGAVIATKARIRQEVTNYTADGAITLTSGLHTIAKPSAAAMTVAAPSSQDGTRLIILSNTDFAHVITFTGSTLLDGTTGANLTVTMTAFKGSAIVCIAVGTKWLLESSSNVTSITT